MYKVRTSRVDIMVNCTTSFSLHDHIPSASAQRPIPRFRPTATRHTTQGNAALIGNVPHSRRARFLVANKCFACGTDAWTGRQKFVRLLPISMLENDKNECIKLEENRNCSLICTGVVGQGASVSLCVAVRRMIYVYELNRTKQRYRRMKDITCPNIVQYISICNERLCVGYASSFAIYSVQGDGSAPVG